MLHGTLNDTRDEPLLESYEAPEKGFQEGRVSEYCVGSGEVLLQGGGEWCWFVDI